MHVFVIGEARPYGELSDILVDDHRMQHLTTEAPVAMFTYWAQPGIRGASVGMLRALLRNYAVSPLPALRRQGIL